MPWLKHPTYIPSRDWLVAKLRQRIVHFGQGQPLIFVCGAKNSTRRRDLSTYLRVQKNALVFFAEDVWSAIGESPAADALRMEEGLAKIADLVVIIVESAGSIAELGAFALSDKLQTKILPILDRKFEFEPSFINTGPVRMTNDRSLFGPAIYTNLDMILRCSSVVESRVDLIKRRHRTITLKQVRADRKYLLLLIISLVGILHPVTEKHIHYYIQKVLGRIRIGKVRELLHLGKSLELLAETSHLDPTSGDYLSFFSTARMPELLSEKSIPKHLARARIVNALQRIPQARAIAADVTSRSIGNLNAV